ncbi:YopX family protein [Enterococcus sp. ZJ1622]|uniref:YopX family protein n=1 Tax=Enterococcus sp. ZJ1622 TaxID=2709401 RepID=UPI001F153066|nr:YopX family protein [Enterococcus sp. ZJ1622]
MTKFRAWDRYEEAMTNQEGIYFGDMDHDETLESLMLCLEERYELMQSTGLKDKNGVEIFEGDIIGSQDKDRPNWYVSHHEIVWHDAGFMGKQICSSSFIGLDFWTRGANGYVVIGNIYENPELLKEVKK